MKIGVISSRANSTRAGNSGVPDDPVYFLDCFNKMIKAFVHDEEPVTIISGGGRGPETFAKQYALDNDYQITVIPPLRSKRGAMAFSERNTSINSVSDALLIFWGGEDLYVATTISEAMFMQKPVMIFPI